jgi:hypothetical protein
MTHIDLADIRHIVASRLPRVYEPLLLTFYGGKSRQAGDDVIIGDDYGTELRLTVDGTVVSIDPKRRLPKRFVNSSILKLAMFLEVISLADRSNDECEREMWSKLADIDPPAFAEADNWWAVVLEQVRLDLGW